MAIIGTISRALLERATAYYVGGNPITVLNAQGVPVIGDAPPAAPEVISTITDRVYEVGTGPYTINLAEKISGAASYVITPASANLSLSGNTLTIMPTATMPQTTISVVGRNGGGDSAPLTFKLTVNAVAPTVTAPLPDQSLAFGAANVTVPLDSYFSGVASYSVSPAANGATISGRNLVLSAAQTRSLEITVTGTNSTGQSVSDTFLFAVAQLQQAPAVTSIPTLAGGATVGGILTRTAGTATGIPAPGRATQWLLNGTEEANIIPGQTSNTLDTSGFAAGDVIRTRDVWTNTISGVVQTATGTSAAWTLTVQPAITATPPALTAGQQATITFNTTPDSVTVTQGGATLTVSGTGASRTFTPQTTEPVSISALKAGWTPYSAVIEDVAPAPAAFVQTGGNLMSVTGATEPVAYTSLTPDEWDGSYTIPVDLSDGPDAVIPPRIFGTPEVGERLYIDLGLIASLDQAEPDAAWEWPDDSTADSYVVRAEDQGNDIALDVSYFDSRGTRVVSTNTLTVPEEPSSVPPDIFSVADQVGIDGKTFESGEMWTQQVPGITLRIESQKLTSSSNGNGAFIRGPLLRGPSQYAAADQTRFTANSYRGVFIAVCIQTGEASYYALRLGLSTITLHKRVSGTVTQLTSAPYPAEFGPGATAKVELLRKPDGSLEGYINGVLLLTATDTTYTDGGIGVVSIDATTDRHILDNFEARIAR